MWHITQDMTLEIVIDIDIDIGHWHWHWTLTLTLDIDIGFLVPHSLSVLRGYYSETWYCQSSTKSHSEGSIKWPTWLTVARCCFIAKWSNISTAWVAPGLSFCRHLLETQQGAIHCFVGALPSGWLPQLVSYPRRITEIAFTMFQVSSLLECLKLILLMGCHEITTLTHCCQASHRMTFDEVPWSPQIPFLFFFLF